MTNMLPNIPNTDWIYFVKEILTNCKVSKRITKDVVDLYNICISESHFQFTRNFYKQQDGSVMCLPFRVLLKDFCVKF